ncbi:MAG: hypothetical protein EI684_01445 [Candidatus Viridilinea halotolerans]|uniref:DUF697 domain-containing protein n=1 Tax=Candidatus Viridilinea halotolerans TaxID=2491704 RepID=A0A426UAR3_9CHLR|nr:MAG: hypothetical protein EI684_01445 [Candidatus Viridilinea halotolerans]
MSKSNWNNIGVAFSTIGELDVSAIQEECERAPQIAVLGSRPLFQQVAALLHTIGTHRFGPHGSDPLFHYPLSGAEFAPLDENNPLRQANLFLILVDGQQPLAAETTTTLHQLARLAIPTVIAICGIAVPDNPGPLRPEFAQARVVILPDLNAPQAAEALSAALIERLPEDLRLAAARAIPALRPTYARELVASISFVNSSYALASAIPEQIPILSVPFAAADILVLTKNQALMVYRLALAHGAAADFQSRMAEIIPVVGAGFIWRQVARTLIGLIPFWGVLPKVAVAYAGTYTTGTIAWRWFAEGEIIDGERLKELADESLRVGRERAAALLDAAQNQTRKGTKHAWRPWRKR